MRYASLPIDEVHLWCARPGELDRDDVYDAARRLIAPEEAQRLERLRFARDRQRYLAARVLVRTVLSRYAPLAPAAWRFIAGRYGRPEIGPDQPALQFNLSHTEGLVVCAVARDLDVGVDAEHIGGPAPLEVVDHCFAPTEIADVRALPDAEQPRRFFEYWTLKESYIKARGSSLALPVDQFAFTLSADGKANLTIDPALGEGVPGRFTRYWPTPEHIVSVCVTRRRAEDAKVIPGWHSLAGSISDRPSGRQGLEPWTR
jgi:4'-phosphopantetheinyl transferase